jgi:hypothetical protein
MTSFKNTVIRLSYGMPALYSIAIACVVAASTPLHAAAIAVD